MFEELKSYQRFCNAALMGLALAGASAVSVQAHAQQADGMTVVRDATTGELRAPTAQEHAALQQKAQAKAAASRVAKQVPLQKYHPNGARGVRVTEEFTSSVVAVRNTDGSIGKQCVEGEGSEHAAHAPASPAAASAAPAVLKPVLE